MSSFARAPVRSATVFRPAWGLVHLSGRTGDSRRDEVLQNLELVGVESLTFAPFLGRGTVRDIVPLVAVTTGHRISVRLLGLIAWS